MLSRPENPVPFPYARDHGQSDSDSISTGSLPEAAIVERMMQKTYDMYADLSDGAVASYIPRLAEADPRWFGLTLASTTGSTFSSGDSQQEFSIQSIAKAFVYALVCEALGQDEMREQIGVNNTGLPFNSVMAIELNAGHTMNPMVNAGALATTSLVPGATWEEKWERIHTGLSNFAGRELALDDDVYASEMETNLRNLSIARLLQSYGHIAVDPARVTELYTRLCSLRVTTEDLAIMGATLANGGVQPVTGVPVVSASVSRDVLSVMATTGMYEASGDWLYEIGMPGKSGVAGGIVTIAPGKGSLATFSPPVDKAGNSVRGIHATRHLSHKLGLNLFSSIPRT
ncbi:glutaminase A [Microbacterium oxydans]|uniref:glutaminase A n=1 Tax=Microbacterium oxydans TaxID=82380 RepID=UPI000FD9D109|nr:glutaminase A [Microbacterium oxydans]